MASYDPCVCCPSSSSSSSGGGFPCCSLKATTSFPFTPDVGFDLEKAEVTNSNKDSCVGRAVLSLELSQAADCPTECTFPDEGVTSCDDIAPGSPQVFCKGEAGLVAIFNELLSEITLPVGWEFKPVTSMATYSYANCYLTGIGLSPNYEECLSGYSTYITQPTFLLQLVDPLCDSDYYVVNAYVEARLQELRDALEAMLGWEKLFSCGNKLYCLKLYTATFYSQGWGCASYSEEYCVQDIRAGLPYFTFTVTCLDMSTDVTDYNWPASLSCTCSTLYDPPKEITATPACSLTKMETSIEFDEASKTFRFKATYKGKLASEETYCMPGSTDPDCICCGES